MAVQAFAATKTRPTALLLNIAAAGYATWRIQRRHRIDFSLLLPLATAACVTAFLGGLVVLAGHLCFELTGVLLIGAGGAMLLGKVWSAKIPRQLP